MKGSNVSNPDLTNAERVAATMAENHLHTGAMVIRKLIDAVRERDADAAMLAEQLRAERLAALILPDTPRGHGLAVAGCFAAGVLCGIAMATGVAMWRGGLL